MTLTLDPSESLASTMGEDSSIRRPTDETILSMILIKWVSSLNLDSESSSLPNRSIKILFVCVDQNIRDGIVFKKRLQRSEPQDFILNFRKEVFSFG